MASKVWTVAFESAHTVELNHNVKTGSRNLVVDGRPVETSAQLDKSHASVERFDLDGRPVEIHFEPVGSGRWYYRLKADDQWLDEPLPPRTIPKWAFAFVGLAVLPTLQLLRDGTTPIGALLCGSMALGASVSILASARDPLLALDRKILKCGLLTALVWGILAVPSLMMMGAAKFLNG